MAPGTQSPDIFDRCGRLGELRGFDKSELNRERSGRARGSGLHSRGRSSGGGPQGIPAGWEGCRQPRPEGAPGQTREKRGLPVNLN